jgi:N-acetylmuramoyl-L-alanine amidase
MSRIHLLLPALLAGLLVCGCRAKADPAPTPLPTTPPTAETPAPIQAPATATPEIISPTAAPAPESPTPEPNPTPAGPLVVIDPGHGGKDWGACHVDRNGKLALMEKEVNLAIALHTRDALEARGVRVFLTRDDDYLVNEEGKDLSEDGEVDYVDELQMRLDMANQVGGTLLLSLHQNAYYYGVNVLARDVGGTVTYYCDERVFSDRNLAFAELVQEHVVAAAQELGYDIHDRGVRLDTELSSGPDVRHLIVLGPKAERIVRPSQMPGALSETMFITHDGEMAMLSDSEICQRFGQAYADAIIAYLAAYDELPEGFVDAP